MKSMRKNEKDYNVFIYRLVYLAGTCMQSDVVLFFVPLGLGDIASDSVVDSREAWLTDRSLK